MLSVQTNCLIFFLMKHRSATLIPNTVTEISENYHNRSVWLVTINKLYDPFRENRNFFMIAIKIMLPLRKTKIDRYRCYISWTISPIPFILYSFSLQYVFVVMLVFVLEAGVGALARLYEEQVGPELKMNLNRTFLENYSMRSRETSAIDQMQIEVSYQWHTGCPKRSEEA